MSKYIAVYRDITLPRKGCVPTYWADLDKCEKKWEGPRNSECLYRTVKGQYIFTDCSCNYYLFDIVEAIPWLLSNGFEAEVTDNMKAEANNELI